MPNINSIQSLSSTGSFKSPTIYREGQRIGSADTFMGTTAINWLPGVSGTYYDKGLLDYKDQANTRYNNQGYVNAFFNFAANLGVKTLDVIPSAAGAFTATQKGLANMAGLNPNQDMFGEAFDNNMFLDFSKSLQLWGNENFPNFQEEGFSQKGFFEQLSSPGQFLTSNIETLGFLTQSIGLAGLLSKAQIGANIVNRIANGRKAAQVLQQANPANYAKLASQIDDAVLNTFLTTNESAMEAMDAKEQIIQKLEQDRSNGLNKFTDQEIQERANNGLANVFGLNMALGAITNGFFTSMLKPLYTLTPVATRAAAGGVNAAAREALGTRANSFALGLMDKGEDAFVKEAQNMSAFKRFLFDSGNSAGMVTKGVLGQMLTEGLEENFQYSIQKANEAYNSNQSFKDSLWNTLKDQVTNGWDMTDEERLKNFGTGALIGGGGPLIGMAATAVSKGGQGGFGPLREAREFRAKREEALKSANTAYTDFFNSSFASKNPVVEGQVATKMQPDGTAKFYNTVEGQTEEITQDDYNAIVNTYSPDESGKYKKGGDFVLDAAGNVVKDQAKAAEFAATTQYQTEMDNLIELESAKANADATKIQLYRLEKLRDLAQVAFRTGTTDLLIQKLETLKNPAQDKMASWGLSDPKEINDAVDSWIKHVERLEANYLQTQNAIVAPVYNDDDREALLNLKLRAADIGNRIVNLYTVQEEIDKELAEKVATVPNKNSEWIGQAFGQGVVTQRTKELKAAAKSPEEAQIAELVAKKKDVQDAIDELSGVYEKMTDPNKGFKQWKASYKKKDFSPYTTKKMGEKELKLTENTSTTTIKNYFEKRANRLNQANRLKLARTYFYNEAIDPFIQYVKQNIRKPEIISEIEKFITDVLEKKLPLTTSQRNKISSIPSQLRQLAKEKEDQFNNLLKRDLIESQLIETIQDNAQLLSTLPKAEEEIYPNAAPNSVEDFANRLYSLTEKDIEEGNYPRLINDLFYYLQGNTDTLQSAQNTGIEDLFDRVVNYGQQLEDLYGEWENLITSADDIERQLNTLLPEIDKLGSIKDLEKTDEQFIKEAIEESFEGPNRVLEASDFDGKTISEEYDDLQAVQKQLEFLKNLNDKAFSKLLDEPMYAAAAKKAGQLIKKLEKVEKLVKKNIANKDVKNKKENIHYAEAALELVSELSFADPKIKELEKKDKDVAAMAVMDLLSEKEPQQLKLIEAKLRQELKTIIENLPILKGARTPLTEEQIQFILANPVRGMLQLFSKIQYEEAIAANFLSSNTFESPITEYTNTYDVVKFKESLKDLNTSTTAEDFKALLTIHAKFIVLDQIIDAENTGFNHVTFLTAVKKFIEQHPNLPVPSVAQMREVRELVTFAKASPEPSNEMYKNGAALRAPAGAGKSLVVSKLFKEVGNFTDGEILTAAKFDLAAKNIAESIGTPDKANTVEALTKSLKEGKVPPKTKIIIIDEAAALGGNEINDFAAALAAYNKAHPNGKLKFILLYDPNQITQGGLGKSPLDGSFIGDLSTTTDPEYFAGDQETKQQYRTGETKAKQQSVANFSYNLKQITPLSVTYRSSVSEIVDLQNKYKTRQLITEVNTASSVDPNITTEKILGTFSESGSTIAEKISASIRENGKGRTRIILVGSQAKVEKYKAILPDVEVVTVDEAAGIARDEVYVDLEMADNENFKPELPITFNQWMYTAISRAKLYVHIANATKPSHSIDNKIETLKPSESTSKAMVDYLTKAIEDLKAITGQEVVPEVKKEEKVEEEEQATAQEESPQEKAEKDQEEREEETEDENSDTGNEDNFPDEDEPEEPPTQAPIEETDENGEVIEADEASSEEIIISNPPIESTQVGEGFYSPAHTINKVFTTPPNNKTASLKPGDKLMVVKDINPSLGLSRIVLVREVSPGEYQFVSILSDTELRDFSEALGINVNQDVPEYVFKSYADVYLAQDTNGGEEEVNNAPVVYVQEGSSKMVYEYSEQEQHPLSDDYKDGELQTMRVAIQMLEQIYGPNPQDTIADWDNVKENILEYVDIVSFTKPSEIKKKFGSKPAAQLPKVGPAYLIVSGIKTKKGTSIVPQFVMLTGKVLHQGNSEVQAVQRAIKNIAKIEELLPQANLGGSYAEVRLGVPIKIEGQFGDEYYPFHELVTRLSDAYRALVIKGETEYTINFINKKKASELAKIFPDIDATKLDKDLLKAAYDLDILVHGDVDAKRRNYEGMAQIFANNLGRQQLMATTAQGTNVILRDVKGSKRVDNDGTRADKKIQETFGLSLLGPIKWYRERGKSNNKLISKKLRNRLETYATRLEKRGKADSSRYAFVKSILASNANTAHLPPVTYSTLKELFVDSVDKNGNFTLVSDGFGLRTPISKEFNYGSDLTIRQKPVSELVSHLRKIHPTRLVVAKEPNMAAATDAEKYRREREAVAAKYQKVVSVQGFLSADKKRTALNVLEKFSQDEVQAFIETMKASTLEEAIGIFRAKSEETRLFVTKNKNIFRQLEQSLSTPAQTLEQAIEQDLVSSIDAVEVAKLGGKTASRDFVRATILLRAFGIKDPKHIFQFLNAARKNYNQVYFKEDDAEAQEKNKKRNEDKFLDAINHLSVEFKVELADFNMNLYEIIDGYLKLFAQKGLITEEERFDVSYEMIYGPMSFLDKVQFLVELSSKYREFIRKGGAPAIETPLQQAVPTQPVSSAKASDIERRRQEELNKANQKIEKLKQKEDRRVKTETYRTLDIADDPVEVEITTNADGSRVLRARQINEDGSVEPMAYITERINNKAQATLTNEKLIEVSIGNEGGTLQRTNIDENPDQTYIDKINAKYDAQLAALEATTPAQQPVSSANISDIQEIKQENSLLGESILRKLGYKNENRLPNGNVKGGQSGWKIRFNIKNPKTGASYYADGKDTLVDKEYNKRAEVLINFLLDYFGSNQKADSKNLQKQYVLEDKDGTKRQPFKHLSGGEVGESDFTIYIGSADDVLKFISDIRTKHPEILELLHTGNKSADVIIDDVFKGRIEGSKIGFSGYHVPTNLNKVIGSDSFTFTFNQSLVDISYHGGNLSDITVSVEGTNKGYGGVFDEELKKDFPELYENIRNIIGFQLYGDYLQGSNNEFLRFTGVDEINAKYDGQLSGLDSTAPVQQPAPVATTITVQAPQTENNQPDVPTTMELPNTVLVDVATRILDAGNEFEEDAFTIFVNTLKETFPNEVKQLEDLGGGDVYTGAENFTRIDDTTEREKAFLTEDIGREITDKEALEIIDRYTGNNPISKLWRLLRGKGLRENVNIVKYNELVNSRGKKVWGLYKDGVISFARLASGGLSSKLVRHELFHKIFWEYLTVEEQLQALDIAKDNYGDNLNAEQLEERMAEDFESYVSKKDTGFFTRLWNKLKRLLGFTYNNMKSLEQFFDLIEQGAFPYRNKESVIVERNALQFGKKFPNIDDFLIVEKALLESFINAQESRRGRPDVKGRIFSEVNEETGETEYFITKLGATEPIAKEEYDYYKQEYGVEDNRLFTIKGGGDMAAMTFSETITLALANMKELAENPRANTFPKRMAPETAEHIKRVLREALSDSKFIIDLTQYYFGQADIKEGLSRFLKENNADQIELINQILEARAAKDFDPETAEEIDSYLEEFDDADLEDMKKGLENETYDSALVDPTIKLTGSIKQRLISIKYYKNGTSHYADINGAFSAIVPRVSGIPADSLESAVTALEQNFRGFAKFNTARMTLENAVGRYMYNTVSRIKNTLNDPNRIKSVAFRKDVNSEDIYVMHLTEKGIAAGIDIENVVINDVNYGPINRTLARSEALKDYFAVKDVNADNTLHKVITQISEETGVFYDDIAKLYYWYEDIDFIKAIVSSVSSLRKARPFAFQSKWHYGEYRVRGYNIKTESSRQVHETNLEYRLDNYIKDIFKKNEADPNKKLPLFSEEFKKAFSDAQQAKGEDSIKAKRAVIRKFLNLLNYKRKVDFAGDDAIESFFDRLEYALPQMEEAFAETRDNFETEEAYQASKTSEYLLDNESSLLTELAEIINSAYSMSNSSSYIRSDGKKAYGWQEASFQTQILASIIGSSKEGRLVRGAAHLKLAPYSRPVAVSPFLKDNIFVGNNPMNNIESYVDYEAWKEKGQERYSKYIRKETSIDFNKRNIVGNFISVIAAKGSRYMQSLPIPSNRTTVQEVEVSVLNKTAIDTALTRIITSQRNRPNPNAEGNERLRKNKNYMANWQKWKFAGLQGYVTDINPKTKKPYTNKEILDQIKEHVEGQVNNLLPLFQETLDKPAAIKLPISSLNRTASKLGIKTEKPLGVFKKDMSDEEKNQFFKTRDEIVKEILKSFYYNYIINQYSLAQILYSDETFYNGMEDETKRIQILTATGEVTLVDPVHGVPPKSKVLIMEDIRGVVEYDKSQIAESFNAPYEKSDGEGFMLPEFYEKIAHSYGLNAQTDIIMKPVYADIDEQGVPTGIKYSVKVLTDELCQTFPHLAEYRDAMRKVGADQLVFSSAVKMGNINTLAKMNADTGRVIMDSVTQESVITIDNTNFRFQLNPAKKVEADTANGSQMTAMMNTNGQNTVEIYDVHKIDEFLIENGLRDLARKLRTTRKGSMTKRSIENLRKELLSKLENLPGATDVYEILNARLSDGTRAAISMPLISDRVVSTLASMVTDHTVGFRFSGSKLVLQADTAPVQIYNPVTKQMETRFLKFKDENGYTEVILPREYEQYFTLGDVFDAKGKKIHDGENKIEDGVVGFRIPTSNYHSVVSMKVVGFYDVPSNSKGNLIIAPSAIVYYHGSDYDVDTLFIIKKEIYKEKEALNLNNMISVFDPNHKEDPALIFKKGDVPGYTNNKEYRTKNNERLHEYLEVIIRKASAIIDTKVDQANKATVAAGKAIWEEINAMEKNLNKISTIAAAAAKNTKVDLFAKNIREEKNKRDLATPITFTRIVRVRYKIREEIKDTILTDDKFMQKLVEENLIKLEC